MSKELPEVEKMKKIRVADEDVLDWIRSLKEGGLSNEEIDAVMSKLNSLYRKKRQPDFIVDELDKFQEEYREKHGQEMPPEMVEYFKKGLKMRLED